MLAFLEPGFLDGIQAGSLGDVEITAGTLVLGDTSADRHAVLVEVRGPIDTTSGFGSVAESASHLSARTEAARPHLPG